MCKINNTNIGIKDLNFTDYKGKIEAFLSDGRVVIVPVSFFPDIKKTYGKATSGLDDIR
ncbi:MAG: hypothetical protein IJ759_00345 [Bacteroidales bacterium]|nr:hypothetical protein [Bacteroidales bacterium]